MLHPSVFNTSQICADFGIRHVVLSPGSRNAPLILSFARNEALKQWVLPDERSAAFFALGICQQVNEPIAICCTSGTALLNYYPAVTEAYYRELPLIVFSADRPPHLIDQRDGQTIRQAGVLDHHSKFGFQLPIIKSQTDADAYVHILIAGLESSMALPKGPVHFNIPFEEPFYPEKDQKLTFEKSTYSFQVIPPEQDHIPIIDLNNQKVLLLVGQQKPNPALDTLISSVSDKVVVLKSPLNNLQSDGVSGHDLFIRDQTSLAPDVLITAGLSVLSKNLKQFLRKHIPAQHYHLDPSGVFLDTYQSRPKLIQNDLKSFLSQQPLDQADPNYVKSWKSIEVNCQAAVSDFVRSAPFSEVSSAYRVFKSIPSETVLHLANSMPVRFADMFGVQQGIEVFANRGTSGIDGCTSTAFGSAMIDDRMHVLVSGDLAFQYDRNAFFHNYQAPNLRIIIFNNQGGGIFRLIQGPANQPELETYFETRHHRTAKYLCMENAFDYHPVSTFEELDHQLNSFFMESSNAKVLEIFTEPETNQKDFKRFKNHIYEQINH
jgi:2-succinyl-5-enolpyruvyl-6-hydroxy-3-cyclohexene-1-carboxylate synthase